MDRAAYDRSVLDTEGLARLAKAVALRVTTRPTSGEVVGSGQMTPRRRCPDYWQLDRRYFGFMIVEGARWTDKLEVYTYCLGTDGSLFVRTDVKEEGEWGGPAFRTIAEPSFRSMVAADLVVFDFSAGGWDGRDSGRDSYTYGNREARKDLRAAQKGDGLAAALKHLLPKTAPAPRSEPVVRSPQRERETAGSTVGQEIGRVRDELTSSLREVFAELAEARSTEHEERRGISTLEVPHKRARSDAFEILVARAVEVARDLRERGVPGDSYESQRSGGTAPAASTQIGGWIVAGLDLEETLRSDASGLIRGSNFTSVRAEVWLLADGRLQSVRLRNERVWNNMRGTVPNVVPTRVDRAELSADDARQWDSRHTWETRDSRSNGQFVIEEWRRFGKPEGRPYGGLTKALETLRGRRA